VRRALAVSCVVHAFYFVYGLSEPHLFWRCCPGDATTSIGVHPDVLAGILAALGLLAALLLWLRRPGFAAGVLAVSSALAIVTGDWFAWLPALVLAVLCSRRPDRFTPGGGRSTGSA
jgi:hypothetical protein